jgi:hypothetical protein
VARSDEGKEATMLSRNRQARADAFRADAQARIAAATEEARRRRPLPPSDREPQS